MIARLRCPQCRRELLRSAGGFAALVAGWLAVWMATP